MIGFGENKMMDFLLLALTTYYITTALIRENAFNYHRFMFNAYRWFGNPKPFGCSFCMHFWIGVVVYLYWNYVPAGRFVLIPFAIAGLGDVLSSLAHIQSFVTESNDGVDDAKTEND